MSNLKRFSSRKELSEFLTTKEIDTSNWSEEKWLSLNKGQAEIHIMDLAEKIYDAVNESTPEILSPGQWHIPFMSKIDSSKLKSLSGKDITEEMVKISTALSARTSYTVVGEEKEINYENMINLHDRLLNQDPPHSSPFEHCARAMDDNEYHNYIKGIRMDYNGKHYVERPETLGWCYNLKGFISYRYLVDNKINL